MKIEDGYLIFEDNDRLKNKKITGTTFPALIGEDKFKKRGDMLLMMFGFIKEEVDPYYLKRGTLAEKIVATVYARNHVVTQYNPQQLNWDNFPEHPLLGGLIDIELIENQSLIEVKSKSLERFPIIDSQGDRKEELQGMLYGFLRGYSSIIMAWIFFDPVTENEIRNNLPITTLSNLKKIEKVVPIDVMNMKELTDQAIAYKTTCINERRIPLDDISDNALYKLGLKRLTLIDSLPF